MSTKSKKVIVTLLMFILICFTAYYSTDQACAAEAAGPAFTAARVTGGGNIELVWDKYPGTTVSYDVYRLTWDDSAKAWKTTTSTTSSNGVWDKISSGQSNTTLTDTTIDKTKDGFFLYTVQAVADGKRVGNHLVCVRYYHSAETATYLAATGNNRVTVAWSSDRTDVKTYAYYRVCQPNSSSTWGGLINCGYICKDGKNYYSPNSSTFKRSSTQTDGKYDYICSVNIPTMSTNEYYGFTLVNTVQYRADTELQEAAKSRYSENVVFDLQEEEYSCSPYEVQTGECLFDYNGKRKSTTCYNAEIGLDNCIHFSIKSELADDYSTYASKEGDFYKVSTTIGNSFIVSDKYRLVSTKTIRFYNMAYEFQISKQAITGIAADEGTYFYVRLTASSGTTNGDLTVCTALRKETDNPDLYEETEMLSIDKDVLLQRIVETYNSAYSKNITVADLPSNLPINNIAPIITINDPYEGDWNFFNAKTGSICGPIATASRNTDGSLTVTSTVNSISTAKYCTYSSTDGFYKYFYGSATNKTTTIGAKDKSIGSGTGTSYNKTYASNSDTATYLAQSVYDGQIQGWGNTTTQDFKYFYFKIKLNIPVHKAQKVYRVDASQEPETSPAGTTENAALNHSGTGYTTGVTGWSVTDYIPVPDGCKEVSIYFGGELLSGKSCLHAYADKSNDDYLAYWSANVATTRRISDLCANGTPKYIKATFYTANLADCYIKDETHNVYLYKGANVNIFDGDNYQELGGGWIWLNQESTPYITFNHQPKATETNSTNSIYVTCGSATWSNAPGSSSTATDTVRVGYNGSYDSTAMPQGINTYTINSRITYNSGAEVNDVITKYDIAVDTVSPDVTLGKEVTSIDASGSLSIDKYMTLNDVSSGLKSIVIKNSAGTTIWNETYTDTNNLGDTKTDTFHVTIASGITDQSAYEAALTATYYYTVTDVAGNVTEGSFQPMDDPTVGSDPVQDTKTVQVGVGHSGTEVISDSAAVSGWTYQWSFAYNGKFEAITGASAKTVLGLTATASGDTGVVLQATTAKYKDMDLYCYVTTDDGSTFVRTFCEVQVYGRASVPAITAKLNNSGGDSYTEGSWTNKNVYVTLGSSSIETGATDGKTLYGTAARRYQINSNAYQNYSSGFTISTEGESDITANGYNSTWLSSHSGSYLSQGNSKLTVKIDKTAPTITNLIPSVSGGKIKVDATLADSLSGIKSYSISVKGTTATKTDISDAPKTEDLSITTSYTDSAKTYTLTVYDLAGNSASQEFTLLTVDPLNNLYVNESGTASIQATVSGSSSSLTYQWQYYNGSNWVNIPNGTLKGSTFSGTTTNTLTISNANGSTTQLPIRLSVSNGSTTLYTSASRPKGDVNGDGQINATDLTAVTKYVNGTNTAIYLEAADVNKDNAITTADTTVLSEYIDGINTGDPLFAYPRVVVYGKPTVTTTYTANGKSYTPSVGRYVGWTNQSPVVATTTATIASGTGVASVETWCAQRTYTSAAEYTTEAGTWTTNSVVSITTDGIYAFKARAYNNWATSSYSATGAAVSGESTETELKLDTVAPTFDLSVSAGKTTVSNAKDSLSGLANKPYSFDNGSSWTTSTTGSYTKDQQVRVIDLAGNWAVKSAKEVLQPLSAGSTNNILVMSGGSGSVSATPSGGCGVYAYQWQYYNGSNWVNIPGSLNGSSFTGTTGKTLTVSGANVASNQLLIQCVISDGIQTDLASVSTIGSHPKGDVDNSGSIDEEDTKRLSNYLNNKPAYSSQITFESADINQDNTITANDLSDLNTYVNASDKSSQSLQFSKARIAVFGKPSANISCTYKNGSDVTTGYTMATTGDANSSNWINKEVTATITGTLDGGAGVCRVETRNGDSDSYSVLTDPDNGVTGNTKIYSTDKTYYIGARAVNEWWAGTVSDATSTETKGYIKIDRTAPTMDSVTNNGDTGIITIVNPLDDAMNKDYENSAKTWNATTSESGIKEWQFSNDASCTSATTKVQTTIQNATPFTTSDKASFTITDNAGNKTTITSDSPEIAALSTTKIENIRVTNHGDKAVNSSGSTTTTTTGGLGRYSYTWQYWDVTQSEWVTIPNGSVLTSGELEGNTFTYETSNAKTSTLSITNAVKPTTDTYWKLLRCVVSDGTNTVYAAGSHPKGDLNGDGVINNTDKTLLSNYLGGTATIQRNYIEAAAIANYNIINNNDAVKLTNYISGTDNDQCFTYGRLVVFSAPSVPTVSVVKTGTQDAYTDGTWTKSDITVKVENADGTGNYRNSQIKWKTGTDETWTDGSSSATKAFTGTGKYSFSSYAYNTWWDDDTLTSDTVAKNIWIDQTKPTYEAVTTTANESTNEETGLTSLTYTVTVHGAADAHSGLAAKAFSFDGGNTWQTGNSYTFHSAQKLNIVISDAVGNVTEVPYDIPHAYIGGGTSDIEVNEGDSAGTTANISTTVTGTKTYQWQYYQNNTWNNFPSAGTVLGSKISAISKFTISNASTDADKIPIRCVITVTNGSYTNTLITDMITVNDTTRWPQIIVYGKPGAPVITGMANTGSGYNEATSVAYAADTNPAPWTNKNSVTVFGSKSVLKGSGSLSYQYSTDNGTTWLNGTVTEAQSTISDEGSSSVLFRAINTQHPADKSSLIGDTSTGYVRIDKTGPKATSLTAASVVPNPPVEPTVTGPVTTGTGKQQFTITIPEESVDWINFDTGIDIEVFGEDVYPKTGIEIAGLDDNGYSFTEPATWQSNGKYHFSSNGDHKMLIRDKAGNTTEVTITIVGMKEKEIDLIHDIDINLTGYTFGAPETGSGDTAVGGYYMTYSGEVKKYEDKQTVNDQEYEGLMVSFEVKPRANWYVKGELTVDGYAGGVFPVYFDKTKSDTTMLGITEISDTAHVVIDPTCFVGTTRTNVTMTLTLTAYLDQNCTIPVESNHDTAIALHSEKSATSKVNVDTLAPTISYNYNKYTGELKAEIVDDLSGMDRTEKYAAKGAFTVNGGSTPSAYAATATPTSYLKENLNYTVEETGTMVYTAYDKLRNRATLTTELLVKISPTNTTLDYGWKTKHFYMTIINGNS